MAFYSFRFNDDRADVEPHLIWAGIGGFWSLPANRAAGIAAADISGMIRIVPTFNQARIPLRTFDAHDLGKCREVHGAHLFALAQSPLSPP